MDPDFERLMQGTVQLKDLTLEKQEELRVQIQNGTLTLDDIPDQGTRETMKRWAQYFG